MILFVLRSSHTIAITFPHPVAVYSVYCPHTRWDAHLSLAPRLSHACWIDIHSNVQVVNILRHPSSRRSHVPTLRSCCLAASSQHAGPLVVLCVWNQVEHVVRTLVHCVVADADSLCFLSGLCLIVNSLSVLLVQMAPPTLPILAVHYLDRHTYSTIITTKTSLW